MQEFRPEISDAQVVADTVARAMLALEMPLHSVVKRFGTERAQADLTDAFHDHSDGYEMGKYLENCCGWWCMDADMVAALEAARSLLESAHRKAVRAWVKRVSLYPVHQVGATVNFVYVAKMWTGTIVAVAAEDGNYVVRSEALSDEYSWIKTATVPWEQIDSMN